MQRTSSLAHALSWAILGIVLALVSGAPVAAQDPLAIPATDDGLPGTGTIRRYDWFQKLWLQKRTQWAADVEKDQNAIVFLGDSITQGWGADMGDSFPDIKVANRGISGDTTRGMLLRLDGDVIAVEPRAVVMLMGTNDLEERDSAESIAANVAAIVRSLAAHDPKLPILLCKVFPSSASKRRAAADIRRINELCSAAVEGHPQVTVLDTWSIFANAEGDAEQAEFPDLLHPNKLGYAKWAAALRPALHAALATGSTGEPTGSAGEPTWVALFNGRDLSGWTPKIKGHAAGDNFGDTFRVVDGLLTVGYDAYDEFGARFGHLFYAKEFSSYRLRAEYRFVGDQVEGGPGWAFRNSGLMIHGQPVETMAKDQDFPASIEVQLLGGRDKGHRATANLCTPGTNVVRDGKLWTRHCVDSDSETYRGDVWVTVEVEVRGDTIRHLIDGNTVLRYDDPQLDPRDGDAKKLLADGRDKALHGGTISLQSESHPVQFRSVEILELAPPGKWIEPLAAKDLTVHCATEGNWSLVDGVAQLTPREGESGWQRYDHYLWLAGDYAEFEAEFEYRLEARGNSGFYFHVGDRSTPVATGVEVQIYDTPKDKARLTDHDAGGIIPGGPPSSNAALPTGEWNHMHVLCENGQVLVTLNGRLVHVMALDHSKIADRPRRGAIGFQDHSLPIALRRWRVRQL